MKGETEIQDLYPKLKSTVYEVARLFDQSKSGEEKKKCEKGEDYSRCFYRTGFKVDREVSLVGLEFFGPFSEKEESANYRVEVEISRSEEKWGSFGCIRGYFCGLPMYRIVKIMPCHEQYIQVRKGQNIIMKFPQPVLISPNLWTDIKFEINGPKTKFAQFLTCANTILAEEMGPVRFDFLRGSKQLRALHFIE